MTETLSIADARKLALLSQWLPWSGALRGRALDATLAALRHLGYIQIDTISVIARAHHHTLWNRTRRYQAAHLDTLLAKKKIFEYWSHAAAYLPMEDYRFALPRMHEYANGMRHWYQPDPKLMRHALQRITNEGALRSQDFASPRERDAGFWEHKPSKQALEQLFMEGKIMVARRRGFHKVYDLAERVLPPRINTVVPDAHEYARHLIKEFLRANGLGAPAEISYLRRGKVKKWVEECAAGMAGDGELIELQVRGRCYYALPDALELLGRRLHRKRLKILSPFDNFVIQRERMRRLFNFDYQIECYTPAKKRKHGYFSLPVLWDGRLAARVDCKAKRRERVFVIRNFTGEPKYARGDWKERLSDALAAELTRFAAFHDCDRVVVEALDDKGMQTLLRAALRG